MRKEFYAMWLFSTKNKFLWRYVGKAKNSGSRCTRYYLKQGHATSSNVIVVGGTLLTSRLFVVTAVVATWVAIFTLIVVMTGLNFKASEVSQEKGISSEHDLGVVIDGEPIKRIIRDKSNPFSVVDADYSSLPRKLLENFHIKSASQRILDFAPAQFNFLIKEGRICERFYERINKYWNTSKTGNKRLHAFSEQYSTPASQGSSTILAVAVVSSALRNYRERQNVRSTWGHPDVVRISKIPVVFITGATSSLRGQASLVRESLLHRDIVQAEFLDTYNNLTLKSLAGVLWASKHCSHAYWVLKTDDDVLLNVFALKDYLEDILRASATKSYKGFQEASTASSPLTDSGPHRAASPNACTSSPSECILCDKLTESARVEHGSQFGVAAWEWPEERYPPYCHGVGYLVPTASVSRLMGATATTRFLKVEDVFMTGVLARAAGLRLHRMHHYTRWLHALAVRDRVEIFLNGTKLTLEQDRDLEGGRTSGFQVWRQLLQRHDVTAPVL